VNRPASLLVALSLLAVATPAPAEDATAVDRAKRHYQQGSEAFSVGRFEEAIKELEEAYRLSGESVLLYNIAKAYEKLGGLEEAMRHYRDYLDLTRDVAEEDRAEVEKTIAALEERRRQTLPALTVRTAPEGAKVYIDTKARVAGQTPYKERIELGVHKLTVELKGFEVIEKEIEMIKDKPLVLDFELVAIQEFGEIQIVGNVNGARIFLDGKNIGITPLSEVQKVEVGVHRVHMEREDYFHYDVDVTVPKGRTALVNAQMTRIEPLSKAPGRLGWTSVILGSVAMLGAYGAAGWANGSLPLLERPMYNDTDRYKQLEQGELWSWVGGGVLLGTGLTLIIYDGIRVPPQADKPPPEAIPPPVIPEVPPPAKPGAPGARPDAAKTQPAPTLQPPGGGAK
jgi:hypothetical protein